MLQKVVSTKYFFDPIKILPNFHKLLIKIDIRVLFAIPLRNAPIVRGSFEMV